MLRLLARNNFKTFSRHFANLPALSEISRFDHSKTIEEAFTPPSSWYTQDKFHELDKEAVFKRNWIAVGKTHVVKEPGKFFSGTLAGEPYIVVRGDDNKLRAFYNVCKHHGAPLVCTEGECGQVSKFTCPYHGWEYQLNGRLSKATSLRGIKNFKAKENGLKELQVLFACLT